MILNTKKDREKHIKLLEKVHRKFQNISNSMESYKKNPWNSGDVLDKIDKKIQSYREGLSKSPSM